jgi:hypothetical protein
MTNGTGPVRPGQVSPFVQPVATGDPMFSGRQHRGKGYGSLYDVTEDPGARRAYLTLGGNCRQ